MLIHVDAIGNCDECGVPHSAVPSAQESFGHAEAELIDRSRTISSGVSDQDEGRKDHYLAVIKTQTQQMIALGFIRPPRAEWLARTESELAKLNVATLKAIARSAADLLKAVAKSESVRC